MYIIGKYIHVLFDCCFLLILVRYETTQDSWNFFHSVTRQYSDYFLMYPAQFQIGTHCGGETVETFRLLS